MEKLHQHLSRRPDLAAAKALSIILTAAGEEVPEHIGDVADAVRESLALHYLYWSPAFTNQRAKAYALVEHVTVAELTALRASGPQNPNMGLRDLEHHLRNLQLSWAEEPSDGGGLGTRVEQWMALRVAACFAVTGKLVEQLKEYSRFVKNVTHRKSGTLQVFDGHGQLGLYSDLDMLDAGAETNDPKELKRRAGGSGLMAMEAERLKWEESLEQKERVAKDYVVDPMRFLRTVSAVLHAAHQQLNPWFDRDVEEVPRRNVYDPVGAAEDVRMWIEEHVRYTTDSEVSNRMKKYYPWLCLPLGAFESRIGEYHGRPSAVSSQTLLSEHYGNRMPGELAAEAVIPPRAVLRAWRYKRGKLPAPAEETKTVHEAMRIPLWRLTLLVELWIAVLVDRAFRAHLSVPFLGSYLLYPYHLQRQEGEQAWRVRLVGGRKRLPLILWAGGVWMVHEWTVTDEARICEYERLPDALADWCTIVKARHGNVTERGTPLGPVVRAMSISRASPV